ncbi:MAG: DNA replication/repair protein RecF [Parahaliea sp.]
MPLKSLDICHVRNLRQVSLNNIKRINLFYGTNGSGKTSVLEAVHMLAMARSFRGSSPKTLISHGENTCLVHGIVSRELSLGKISLGVQRGLDGSILLRANGENLQAVASLVEYLPLQVINAVSFDLLTGAPTARRQYLNWGVFHVEHGFFDEWQRFQRCIKQRNTCLRRAKLTARDLSAWTRELARSGTLLNEYRKHYFARLAPLFREIVERLLPDMGVFELHFRQGWDKRLSFEDALLATQTSDKERGFTQVGPQRADLRIVYNERQAADVLSRGQQKLVVCALKLAQGQLLQEVTGYSCTYLVDDLPSELDEAHCRRVCEELKQLNAQIFMTCVDVNQLPSVWPQDISAVFHVEHGKVEYEGAMALSINKTERFI